MQRVHTQRESTQSSCSELQNLHFGGTLCNNNELADYGWMDFSGVSRYHVKLII